jgi:hypothetical protein
MAVQTQIQTRRGTAASWTSTNPTLAAGEIGFESDTGKIKIGTGSTAWNALAYTASSTAVTYLFNATAAQTTFSGADANGLTLAYTVGSEQVYLNGVLQVRGSDYTATNGTSIVLTSGALVSDVLNVIAFSALALSDTYTQAQADARFVQQSNNFFAGKNKIINGDFSIWQRGTSFTPSATAPTYATDRMIAYWDGTGTTTFSRQTFTPGTAPVAGYEGQYFLRSAMSSGSNFIAVSQKIENVQTFANQTVTLSFWAKATSSVVISPLFRQEFGSGGSALVDTYASSVTLTSSWARYSVTVAIPSIAGKTVGTGSFLQVYPFVYTSGTIASNTLDLWGVQVEAGSIATPFQTATGTIQGELAACQRYFQALIPTGTYQDFLVGSAADSTAYYRYSYMFPVQMRTAPTLGTSGTAGDYANLTSAGVATASSTPALESVRVSGCSITVYSSSVTKGYSATLRNTTSYPTNWLTFSAEL